MRGSFLSPPPPPWFPFPSGYSLLLLYGTASVFGVKCPFKRHRPPPSPRAPLTRLHVSRPAPSKKLRFLHIWNRKRKRRGKGERRYVKNKAYMTGQTAPGGDFPATGRTLARKRWPWPKRDPSRERRFFLQVLLIK